MSFLRKTIYALLLLPLLGLGSCTADDPANLGPEGNTPEAYLELTVTTGGTLGSRSNPTGGEEGDGYEHGRNNENTIYNLTFFVYVDKDKQGLDSESNEIVWSKYVGADETDIVNGNPDFSFDRIYNVRIPLTEKDFAALRADQGTLRGAIVANAGDLTELAKGSTIKALCSKICEAPAWTQQKGETVDQSDYFVMSSAFNGAKRNDEYKNDGLLTIFKSNTEGIVYSTEITLERVAARIDLQFSKDVTYTKGGNLVYNVKNTKDRTVTILNTIPVNLMQKHSYLFKHLSDGVEGLTSTGPTFIAADETTNNGIPTDYVLTPNFFDKLNGNLAYERLFEDSYAGNLRDKNLEGLYPMSGFGKAFTIESDWNTPTADQAITIAYANENTQSLENHDSDNITGLVFRAQYNPGKVYTSGDIKKEPEDYRVGDDFWLFRTVGPTVGEKNNLYFKTEVALSEYLWTLPQPNEASYETVKYTNGICYYNIWIKHANIDGSDDNFPMKYGIVRNNIYRISLNFNGVGQPTPEITEPYNVSTRIYVIKWNFRLQPEIIM